MAHFALIVDDVVQHVIVVDNNDCGGGDFPDSEPIGQQFLAGIGKSGMYLQTSYNNNFRGWFAGEGFTYDSEHDVFVVPGSVWDGDSWIPPFQQGEDAALSEALDEL